MMNNFAEKFEQLEKDIINEQRKMPVNAPLSVFYGITSEKLFRLAFVSKIRPFELESTKQIKVTQGKESVEVYWTCFDLINEDAKDVFFIFCDSLIQSIENAGDEASALNNLKERYYAWKLLLKNKGKMSYEMYQGLYGELYFLSEYIGNQFNIDDAVKAWAGPDGYSKDFSIGNHWFEIKTIGTSSTCVKINSLSQLDSEISGHLVTIVVEKMSEQFNSGLCGVHELYDSILNRIKSPIVKDEFANKVLKYGYIDDDNPLNNHKFEVKRIKFYKVDNSFPRLTKENIKNPAIANVTYDVLINAIEKYVEEYK